MKTCICVIIKDEEEYLDEWLSWHLNLGIDEIFLYEDYGSKSHLDIVKPYGDRVHLNPIDVIFKNNPNIVGVNNQEKLFFWFPNNYKGLFDWVLFNDIDEFLILKQPLQELLEEYNNKGGILLKWRWYGASGYIKKPQGKVMDNYTKYTTSTFDNKWAYKSFVNLKKYTCWENIIHKAKDAVFPLDDIGCHKAWLNHYFTKSWEEWKIKILERGDVARDNRKIMHFFQINQDMLPLKENLLSEITK